MKFKSAICTSVEQSKHLLELGLKKETADMSYIPIVINHKVEYRLDCSTPKSIDIPAWSLHRLMQLVEWNYNFWSLDEAYNIIIGLIEDIISSGEFNQDYLEERK